MQLNGYELSNFNNEVRLVGPFIKSEIEGGLDVESWISSGAH
jgi:hypothetical protein